MKHTTIALLALLTFGILGSGCASTFTGIRQVSGNTYLVTRTDSSFFGGTNGSLYRCEANGVTMNCTLIGAP